MTILALVATTGLSAFGQGFITFSGANALYDTFNGQAQGVGVGKRGSNGEFDVAFLWTTVTSTSQDPLASSATGTQSSRNSAANKQTATNGVYAVNESTSIAALLGAGFQFATNGTSLVSVANQGAGTFNYQAAAAFALANSTAGATIQIVAVAWNASAGLTAILNGIGITDFGYSNPFDYVLGTSAGDPNATVAFTSSGQMNEFGVAATSVPEPTTFALAGLGAAAMLIFRKRKDA